MVTSPRQMLQAACQLRWIQTPLAGLESYFFAELIAHPVVVTNMRGIFYDTIPDHVLCFILCFARDMPRYWAAQQQRTWRHREGTSAFQLAARTLGIVGLGGIGYGVAKRAAWIRAAYYRRRRAARRVPAGGRGPYGNPTGWRTFWGRPTS